MSKYIIVTANKQDAPTRADVRKAAREAYEEYVVAAIADDGDEWSVRLERIEPNGRISTRRRVAELPKELLQDGPPEEEVSKPTDDVKEVEEPEEESEEDDDNSDEKEDKKEKSDKKEEADPVEELSSLVDQMKSLLDDIVPKAEKVKEKADKVDEVRDLVDESSEVRIEDGPSPEDIGPVPGGGAPGGPTPPMPQAPRGPDKRKRPPTGVPAFSKRRTRIVRREADIALADAAMELSHDQEFADYDLDDIKYEPRSNQYVAKLKLRQE